jgi:glycosyltransferase 2 family protein
MANMVSYKDKTLSLLKFIFFLGLGIFIIWLSLKNLNSSEKIEIIKSFNIANYYWVALMFILFILSHLFRGLRWILLLEPMGFRPSLNNTFYAVMVGYFANLAFPRLGEVTRCSILTKYENVPFHKGFGTVITERAIDVIVFLSLFLLTILTQAGTIHDYLDRNIYPKIKEKISILFASSSSIMILIGAGIFFITLCILFRHNIGRFKIFHKIKDIIAGFLEGLRSLSQVYHPILFIIYTIVIWGLYFFMIYFCFYCFHETSSLSFGAGLSALVLGCVGIMITPGGIGLYPAIIQETLILYKVSNTTGLALGWIIWTAQTIMVLVVGGASLLLLSFNKSASFKAETNK